MRDKPKPNTGTRRLTKQALHEIKTVIRGIKDGRLAHQQTAVHCGSAHCVAGWKAVLDYGNQTGDFEMAVVVPLEKIIYDAVKKDFVPLDPDIPVEEIVYKRGTKFYKWLAKQPGQSLINADEMSYAQMKWGLTDDEAHELFNGGTTLEHMESMIEKWEQGFRYVSRQVKYKNSWGGVRTRIEYDWVQRKR